MAEIYNFTAFKKEKEQRDNKKREKPNYSDKVNLIKLTDLLVLVSKLVSRTGGNPHGDAYFAKYNLVKTYTDAEIVGWINNFDAREVTATPLFYMALIDTARERELTPLPNHDK